MKTQFAKFASAPIAPTFRNVRLFLPLFLLVAVRAAGQGFAPTFPAGHFNGEGNSYSTIPFTGSSNSIRFQQVFDAAGFIAEGGNTPYYIWWLELRTDGNGPGFSSRFPAFQINLSTTINAIDGLSTNFAENLGPDDAIVIPFGPYQVSGDYVRGNDPQLFQTSIRFPTPFYYDPSKGNLLLDIRNFGGGSTSWGVPPFLGPAYVDASSVMGDRVSSVSANDVNAPFGTTSTLGLVTRIGMSVVPKLTVFRQSTNLLVRWFNQLAPYALQASASLGPGAVWGPAGGIATTNGGYREVTLPLDPQAGARFFRLVLPLSSPSSAGIQTTTHLETLSKPEH